MLQGDYHRFYRHLQTFHSPSSLGHYHRWLTRWAFYLDGKDLGPWDATPDHVTDWVHDLKREYSPQTVGHVISYMRSLYQWGIDREKTGRNPWLSVRRPREGRSLPNVICQADMMRLLTTLKPRTPRDARDRAILYFLYSTGCRVSEVCDAKMNRLDLDSGRCTVRGKGQKDRVVRLTGDALTTVRYYVEYARRALIQDDDPGFVFLSVSGQRLARHCVAEAIDRAKERTGLTARITPHTFRHSFCTHLMENGAGLREIQELAGHERISTTEIYVHVTNVQLDRAYERAHPLAIRWSVGGVLVQG